MKGMVEQITRRNKEWKEILKRGEMLNFWNRSSIFAFAVVMGKLFLFSL